MKARPDELEMYGFGLTRRTLIAAIAHHVQLAKTDYTISREDALKIAVETSRVVGEFISWVEKLHKIQMEALSIYSPYSARAFMEKDNVKPNQGG